MDLTPRTTKLIILNEETDASTKIVKYLAECGLLINSVSKNQLKMKQRNKKKKTRKRFLSMLLDTLGALLVGNLLTAKGVKKSYIPRKEVMSPGKDTIRAGQNL